MIKLGKALKLTILIVGLSLTLRGGVSTTYASTLNCNTAVNINVTTGDCQALLDFYDSTNGPGWTIRTNWDTDTDVNNWYGVDTALFSAQRRVIKLGYKAPNQHGRFWGNNLSGTLPTSLSVLDKMTHFEVSANGNITGPLSPSWSAWTGIQEFYIQGASINGTLPPSWSAWTNIQKFILEQNELTGTLPSSWSARTGIKLFSVAMNQITGTLPSLWSAWTVMEALALGNNQLNGTLPDSWSSMTRMQQFYAGSTNITGSLPPSWSTWTGVWNFNVANSQLNGTLPDSYSAWTNISSFAVYNNNLNGILPPSWSTWTGIHNFFVDDNNLTGYIPSSWYPTRPNAYGQYIHLKRNCIYKAGYSSGMQTWVNNRADMNPQDLCFTLYYLTGSTGGTISGIPTQNLQPNGTGTAVTAIPNTGYALLAWSDGYTGTTRTDGNVTGSLSFVAFFTGATYTLTYAASAGGSISGSTPQTVGYLGTGTSVTAIPNTGSTFVGWSDGYTGGVTRIDGSITGNRTYNALFSPITYILSYSAGIGGAISGSTSQTVGYLGTGTAVTAVPNPGSTFAGWSDGYIGATRIDSLVTGNIVVTANFSLNTYFLDYTGSTGGFVSGDISQIVLYGATGTTVYPIAYTGYAFLKWSTDNSTANPRTDGNITSDQSWVALFTTNTHTLTYIMGTGCNSLSDSSLNQIVADLGTGLAMIVGGLPGNAFSGWSDGSTANPRTDGNVTGNITVTALCTSNIVNLNYMADPGGSIVGPNPQTIAPRGVGLSVTAVPDTGYVFLIWDDGYTGATRMDGGLSGDVNVTASFAPRDYILTYNAQTGGFVSGPTPQTVSYLGTGTAVEPLADPGYTFLSWSDGSIADPRIDSNVTGDITVTALYTPTNYTLSYSASIGGTVSGSTYQTVWYGGTGTAVYPIADTGYTFVGWSDSSTADPRTDSGVTYDIIVTAFFTPIDYTLTYLTGVGGIVSGDSIQTVAYGGYGTAVYPIPNTGYTFLGRDDSSTADPRLDGPVTGNMTLTALFTGASYILDYSASVGGSISGSASQTVGYLGTGTAVEPLANTGYTFSSWSDGSTDNPRTDGSVTGDVIVMAFFTPINYTLTYDATTGGSISGSTSQTVGYLGTGTSVTAVPGTGYTFVMWVEDGSTGSTRFETSVTGDMTFTALFTGIQYTLEYTGSLGGTVTGSLSQTVGYLGTGTAVTAVPDSGYSFIGWSDGNTGAIRIDSNVTASIAVTALFIGSGGSDFILHYMTGNVGGSISGSVLQVLASGSNGTSVTAVPATGYIFSGWSDGNTGATRLETNVTGDLIYTGYFSTIPVVIITSGGGGGGGGGGGQLVDNCPNGDFSPSYYDNTCLGSGGSGSVGGTGNGGGGNGGSGSFGNSGPLTGHGVATTFTQDFICKYTDGDFAAYKNTFIDMESYRKSIMKGLDRCIFHGQKRGEEFRPGAYTTYGASYKIFVRLAGLEVRESNTKLGNRWSDRYKKIGIKAGLRKGVSFPANPDTLVDSRIFAKMLQNLFNYYGYTDLRASDFVKGNGKLTRGKMSQIVAKVIDALENYHH